ncbi:MAG TPA: hypothetical protein VFA47_12315 [Candidatus Manganitrophaceae bacterium]|nr:hypothetical protein [Candidatus Manganitrophaceae bacterium]
MEVKGKSGWFVVDDVEVRRAGDRTQVDVRGKRSGKTPSIILTGSEKEFFELCNKILNGMISFRAAILAARISTLKKKGDSYGDR